jgi:ABC-type Fe3+-siderophore transport system permease subunit
MWRWILVIWTLAIWGGRLRNIITDNELTGVERIVSLGVAVGLIAAACALLWAMVRGAPWKGRALAALVVLGIARWTLRGPVILLSDDWETSFKIVHTILWLGTVALSLAAWREHRLCESQ